jgi:hypothetical protein
MSDPAFQPLSLRVFEVFRSRVSRLAIALVLCGGSLAGLPAQASEYIPGPLFGGPGDSEPYRSRLDPRVLLAPMPERNPFMRRPHLYRPDHSTVYEPPLPPLRKKRHYVEDDYDGEPETHAYSGPRYDHPPRKPVYDGDRYDRGPESYGPGPYHETPGGYGADHEGEGFGRLFPGLIAGDNPYRPPSYEALRALGRAMVERAEADDPAGDSELPAGYTFFGQFISHDVELETTTELGREIEGDFELKNNRTSDLDLDSVYGGGPKITPHLYQLPYIRVGRPISGKGALPRYDLFRTKASYYYGPAGGDAVALLGDPRNDENIVISQLHAAFVAFHNRTVDILVERDFGNDRDGFCHPQSPCDTHELAQSLPDDVKLKLFEIARDHVIHYYHRLIVEDFLPRVIGLRHTASLLKRGRDFFYPNGFGDENGKISIPIEFAAAAFRYGHSEVRDSYVLRDGVQFDLLSDGRDGSPRAFTPVTPRFLVDWRYFFDLGGKPPYGFNFARRIDTELVRSLHRLHFSHVVGLHEVTSLASRNLARGKTMHVPSGQEVAKVVLPVLEARGLLGEGDPASRSRYGGELWRAYLLPPDERTAYFLGEGETPLWYYILQEASIFGTPTRLHAAPYGKEERYLSGDYPSKYHDGLFRRAAVRYPHRPHRYDPGFGDEGYGGPDGGHRLGPVGATIVGEVLTGLIDHYRETTGKGLDYQPQIRGSESAFVGLDTKEPSGHRYLMRNFLIDAGVVEDY